MEQINDNIIMLIVIILSIIICFKTKSTLLCLLLIGIIISYIYNNKCMESMTTIPNLLQKYNIFGKKVKKDRPLPDVEKFLIDKNSIKILLNHVPENKVILDENNDSININQPNENNDQSNKNTDFINNDQPNENNDFINIDQPSENNENKETFIVNDDIPSEFLGNSFIDGDESIAYNSIHRNEPTRVIVGMQKAYQNLSKYVLEEVEEVESKEWWGNNEY